MRKTAYDMRSSDWSSNVCASDLLGFTLADNEIQDAFVRFKDLADAKKGVYDEDIIALVDDTVLRHNDRLRFVSLQVICGSKGPQTAELEMEIDGTLKTAKATGNGPEIGRAHV